MGELKTSIIAQAMRNLAQARQCLSTLESDDPSLTASSFVIKHTETLTTLSALLSSDAMNTLTQFATEVLKALQNGELLYTDEVHDVLCQGFDRLQLFLEQCDGPDFDEPTFLHQAEAFCGQADEALEPVRNAARASLDNLDSAADNHVEPLPDFLNAWLAGCHNKLLCDALFTSLAYDKPLQIVIYRPDPDCFFRGEDPYAIASACPGFIGQRIKAKPYIEGPEDVFLCHLDMFIFTIGDEDELVNYLSPLYEQVEVATVSVYQLFPFCSHIIREALLTEKAEYLNDMLALEDAQQVACASGLLFSEYEDCAPLKVVYAGIEQLALEPASLERFLYLLSFNPEPAEAERAKLMAVNAIDGEPVTPVSTEQSHTAWRQETKALLEKQKWLTELMLENEQDVSALANIQCALAEAIRRHVSRN